MKLRFLAFVGALLISGGSVLLAEVFPAPLVSTTTVGEVPVPVEPFVWPVSAMIAGRQVKVVSNFGPRQAPETELKEVHEGIDFGVPADSNVRAARSGKVRFVGFSSAYVSRLDKTDKNHLIIIIHADGTSTRYVHLNALRVRPGQEVQAGDIVGTSSDSDEWTEPVVHFEIRDPQGKPLDPMKWLTEPGNKPAK